MNFRPGKLFLIILVPALAYGALKGVLYFNAKRTVDDLVTNTAHMADIRYSDISTDLRGAVTVSGISIQPLGFEDTIGVDAVRIASDDPMFFIRGAQWQPGETAPPNSLSFSVSGVNVPLTSDLLSGTGISVAATDDAASLCSNGLEIEPGMLMKLGFSELAIDMDGYYRLDETSRSLEMGMNMDLHDIESMQFSATMNDVDVQTLAGGGAPQFSLGRMSFRIRVVPEFGRQALKACAVGTEQTVEEWSAILADKALAKLQEQGLSLGQGLSRAVHEFYRDWGSFELRAAPSQPVGLLSLMFLPPSQLADTLGLQLSLNSQPITDARFQWQQPQGQGLAAMLGGEQPGAANQAGSKARRVIVRRSFEGVSLTEIDRYVGHQIQLTPRGQPMREGRLSAVGEGEVAVQQALHGGKYTVHVPLDQIESVKVLVRSESPPES